jgi:hypothetical protein
MAVQCSHDRYLKKRAVRPARPNLAACPTEFERAQGTWSGRLRCPAKRGTRDEEEIVMTRIAKLVAVAAIPALLIAAPGPLLAAGGGGGGGGAGAGVGAGGATGVGVGASGLGAGHGHGSTSGVGHGSSVSAATPGRAMQAAFPNPQTRGAHHGASSFSPGHAMQAAFPNPQTRGAHRGASSFAPGR